MGGASGTVRANRLLGRRGAELMLWVGVLVGRPSVFGGGCNMPEVAAADVSVRCSVRGVGGVTLTWRDGESAFEVGGMA
jgi:hypothetical protein